MPAHYAKQRRSFSLLMSASWVGYGSVVVFTVPDAPKSLAWLPGHEITNEASGLAFILMGIAAAVLAYESRDHPRLEHYCYGLLVAGPILMGILSIIAGCLGYSPLGYASGFRFLMFGAATYFVAGLKPSDYELRKVRPRHVTG